MSIKCVNCTTQEEWDFVNSKLPEKFQLDSNVWKTYRENSYKFILEKGFGDITGSGKSRQITSFNEWLNNYNKERMTEKGMKEFMLDVLSKTYENKILRRTTVPLFMSDPGIGKTTITEEFVRDFVESKGNKMVTMVLPNLMPNEAVGGVYPNQITRVWEFYDSEKLACLNDGDVLFLDEVFNGTLKQTLDAMLNVLGQRRLGSGKKLADVMIIAASNPQGLINLTPQIKERFIRYDLKFHKEEYQDYLKDKYGMPIAISQHLCTLINKEKFEHETWNYNTSRSLEKAINQIGVELKSAYDDVLIPYLEQEIESPMDITTLEVKKGDKVKYLEILKLISKSRN
jgi:hypothetical protein